VEIKPLVVRDLVHYLLDALLLKVRIAQPFVRITETLHLPFTNHLHDALISTHGTEFWKCQNSVKFSNKSTRCCLQLDGSKKKLLIALHIISRNHVLHRLKIGQDGYLSYTSLNAFAMSAQHCLMIIILLLNL